MNPIALPLAAAGLVFYFGAAGARYRVLGWTFVFLYLMLTLLRVKSYFLAPAYPLLFAPGAVLFERFRPRPALSWIRPVYLALLVLGAIALAPDVMPILPAATLARVYPNYPQVLADRFGWDGLTRTVEGVYAALPPAQRARACVLASNYGEAGALQQLAAPGSLPPVLSGHNNYFLWGPGACTGSVLILVGFGPSDLKRARTLYTHATQTAVQRCRYCVSFEQVLPIYVLSSPRRPIFPRSWPSLKHYD